MRDFLREEGWFVAVAMAWAILASAVILSLCAKDAHALVSGSVGGPDVVMVRGAESGVCYKAVRDTRSFDRLYKSRSIYQYHFIGTVNCSSSTLAPERVPGARWSIMSAGSSCFEVMRTPLQTTIGLYPPERVEYEQSWGVGVPCPR